MWIFVSHLHLHYFLANIIAIATCSMVNFLATLLGHAGAVWGASLSDDGQLLATGSFDGTVKLWNTHSGAALSTLRPERRYERLDITSVERSE